LLNLPKINGTYFANTFGGQGSSGTIQAITNGESFSLILLSNANLAGGCLSAGNVILPPNQSGTKAQLAELYGAAPIKYPRSFAACVSSELTQARQEVGIVVTYTPTQ
jgi:hypothetical protein